MARSHPLSVSRATASFRREQAFRIARTERKFVSLCSSSRHPKLSVPIVLVTVVEIWPRWSRGSKRGRKRASNRLPLLNPAANGSTPVLIVCEMSMTDKTGKFASIPVLSVCLEFVQAARDFGEIGSRDAVRLG